MEYDVVKITSLIKHTGTLQNYSRVMQDSMLETSTYPIDDTYRV